MRVTLATLPIWLVLAPAQAQTVAQSSSLPAALPSPAMNGPLQAAPPTSIAVGPLKLDVNGAISGIGLSQSNPAAGEQSAQFGLGNGQIFLQKAEGWWQFYLQAGGYDIPVLGSRFVQTGKEITDLFGPVPVAYLKLVPAKNTSVLVGALPTLVGEESVFTFQNMNIQRGLLWNQENTVNRGIQLNETLGGLTASLSWNDGYYSNRYSCLSGALSYVTGPHTVAFSAMGNLSQTAFHTFATPVQNNGATYSLSYTYSKDAWTVQPYVQYTGVTANPKTGIRTDASAEGAAVLLNHIFTRVFSLPGRIEYLSTTGDSKSNAPNLLYGPGSAAWSLTLTPTLQYQRFFVRGDLSMVWAQNIAAGAAFGDRGAKTIQPRVMLEIGLLF